MNIDNDTDWYLDLVNVLVHVGVYVHVHMHVQLLLKSITLYISSN
jgi:hypothetical protein